jgi:hypothetical protein
MKFLKANWNDRHRTLPSDRRFDLRIDVWGAIRSIRTGFFVDLIETAAVQLEVDGGCLGRPAQSGLGNELAIRTGSRRRTSPPDRAAGRTRGAWGGAEPEFP